MFVKHGKCYMTKSKKPLKVRFVKDHNSFNVEIGWIGSNGEIYWEYYCEAKSMYSEVDIECIEKEIHNNYDVILKFLCSEKIQFKSYSGDWFDVGSGTSIFYLNNELRVKKNLHEYRVYSFNVNNIVWTATVNYSEDTNSKENIVKNIEAKPNFIKWISDWIKVE